MNINLLKNKNDIDSTCYVYINRKFNLLLQTDKDSKYLSKLSFLDDNLNIENENKNMPYVISQTIKELDEYFNEERKEFTIPLAIYVKEFQYNVLKKTADIKFGDVTTYGAIAKELQFNGNLVSRAVGRAEATNPIAIIIPCHRVLAYNYLLNGYAFGLPTKEYLLKLEGHKIISLKVIY